MKHTDHATWLEEWIAYRQAQRPQQGDPMPHIEPTVGRVLWYFESKGQFEPLSAQIAKVNYDVPLVRSLNIGYLRESGQARSAQDVPLVQQGSDNPAHGHFCRWMPYQLGQAAKTEEMEAVMAHGTGAQGTGGNPDNADARGPSDPPDCGPDKGQPGNPLP